MTNDYFALAKKAALAKNTQIAKENGVRADRILDASAVHAAAIVALQEMVPGKAEAFYGDMGWQVVLAIR